MQQAVKAAAPWHLWVVGVVSLLWNAFGCYDYLMTQTESREYLTMMEAYGVTVDEAIAYYSAFPAWADFSWALGVWGSLAGSVLLLLRSRFAFHAFLLSLLGLLATMPYSFGNPLPGVTDSSVSVGMTAAITIIIVLLVWYARAMTRRGVLR